MSNKNADLRVPVPDGRCQCNPRPGYECGRLATQEDLLCDACRMMKKDAGMVCYTTWYNGKRVGSDAHEQMSALFSLDDAYGITPGTLRILGEPDG
jgi:hypothetical protein